RPTPPAPPTCCAPGSPPIPKPRRRPPVSEQDEDQQVVKEMPGPGAQRAAAVLLGLGPEIAAGVFRLLDENSVRLIAMGARELRKTPENVPPALTSFIEQMDSIGGDALAGDGMLREMAVKVMG